MLRKKDVFKTKTFLKHIYHARRFLNYDLCTNFFIFLLLKFWFIVTFFLFSRCWWYLWIKLAKHNIFEPLKCFFEKRVKRGTYRNFCKICPKFKKFQFFIKFEYIVPFLSFFTLLLKNGSGNIFSICTPFLGPKTPI